MAVLRLAILLMLMLSGCSGNLRPQTMGLRVFNENPRHFAVGEMTEQIWLEMRAKDTDETIFRAMIPNGFHSPMEFYFLPRNQSGMIFMMTYVGINQETGKYGDIDFEQLIPGDRDQEIRIKWIPYMPPETPLLEQLRRKPQLQITDGHNPWF